MPALQGYNANPEPRQTGITTQQMQDAPNGALYVWLNDPKLPSISTHDQTTAHAAQSRPELLPVV